MIQRIPGLSAIGDLIHRKDRQKQAGLALARLMTQLDMESMPYDEGVRQSRRDATTRYLAIGVWLVPVGENEDPQTVDLRKAVPAATCDLRRHGIGVMIPVRLESPRFIVAIADIENIWRYFLVRSVHITGRPGGWFHLGLHVERIWEPTSLQTVEFRNRVENVFGV